MKTKAEYERMMKTIIETIQDVKDSKEDFYGRGEFMGYHISQINGEGAVRIAEQDLESTLITLFAMNVEFVVHGVFEEGVCGLIEVDKDSISKVVLADMKPRWEGEPCASR